jgi:hypothetical protein
MHASEVVVFQFSYGFGTVVFQFSRQLPVVARARGHGSAGTSSPVVSENSAGRDPVTGYGKRHGTIGP